MHFAILADPVNTDESLIFV
jgi:hypothetical protein